MSPENQPELIVHYKEDQARTGLLAVIGLSPIWGVWSLYVASWLLKALIQAGISGYEDLFALLCFYIGLVATGAFTIFVCLDNKLAVTPTGIKLPWRFLFESNFLRRRPWEQLNLVQCKGGELLLRFREPLADSNIRFKLDGLKSTDLKDLIVAVRSNAPDTECVFDQKAVELGISGKSSIADGSFTAIWERDLASRFGSTAFVPLEARSTLQNGRFTVVGQVSFGGLSAIYLCKDKLGDTVILKEAVVPLNADRESQAKALEMFKKEARILEGLVHPNIARVLDHFVENDHHYIVLQHVNGLDLRAYVREHGPQGERMIMRWALEIADILAYLHSQDPPIIHRDVTPDNLVLDKSGVIKLIDFGAANEFLSTATGTLIGKQAYISPEQFRGKATPDSDIYSLGCTLYHLATGSDPEALSQSSLPDELAANMPELNKLIADCTAMETSDRLSSMEQVCDCARQYLKAVHVSA